MLSHYVVFCTGYLLIEDITIGWLCLNIWHNAQYIFFVWLSNTKRFKDGTHEDYKCISKLSQIKYISSYVIACLLITFMYYGLIRVGISLVQQFTAFPLAVIIYMSINFHHYVVDGIIWKKERNYKINNLLI